MFRSALASGVSIHAPAWGATSCDRSADTRCPSFNPRPRMGSDENRCRPICRPVCFNPRPRMGSDKQTGDLTFIYAVSIHAPAWGATFTKKELEQLKNVSIHAPAWGATVAGKINQSPGKSFNPRPRMGSDFYPHGRELDCIRFQSTPPHGERRGGGGKVSLYKDVSIHAPAWGATFRKQG